MSFSYEQRAPKPIAIANLICNRLALNPSQAAERAIAELLALQQETAGWFDARLLALKNETGSHVSASNVFRIQWSPVIATTILRFLL